MNFKEFVARPNTNVLKKQITSITQTIRRVFFIPKMHEQENKVHSIADRYWQNKKLLDWVASHGIKVPKEIPPYADGGVGRVYFLEDKVVKLSVNKIEANVAKMVANNEELPTVIVDVISIDGKVYAIMQEFVDMDATDELIKEAADFVVVIIDNNPNLSSGWPKSKSEIEALCKTPLEKYRGNPKLLPWMVTIIEAHSKLYQATGFFHDDAGHQNIGTNKKGVVFPDLGPNETGVFDPKTAMDKIHQNRSNLGLPPHKEI